MPRVRRKGGGDPEGKMRGQRVGVRDGRGESQRGEEKGKRSRKGNFFLTPSLKQVSWFGNCQVEQAADESVRLRGPCQLPYFLIQFRSDP